MSNFDTKFAMRSLESRDPSCVACWELNRRVPAACGSESGWERTAVGIPTSVLRWFALVRQNEHWFGPRQGSGPLSLDKDALLLSFLRSDGQHLVLVAVSGFDDITGIFRADEKGHIVLISRNDREEIGIAHVFAAVGPTWHSAVEAAMEATKDYAHRRTAQQDQGTGSIAAPISEKERDLASWYDGFTYCTWNGLGQHLTPAKILKSLDLLKANDIDISNLIIDDNWQSLDFSGADNFYHRWTDFEANPENFPGGLKSLISDIRRRNPGIIDIAVWHGIFRYWGGMSPDNGKLARDYFMRTFNRQEGIFLGDGTMATVDGADVGRLYDEFYRYGLSSLKYGLNLSVVFDLTMLQVLGKMWCDGGQDGNSEFPQLPTKCRRPVQPDEGVPRRMACCHVEALSRKVDSMHGTDSPDHILLNDKVRHAQDFDEKFGRLFPR